MPIDSLHPQYETMQSVWRTCRDAFDGERAVKAGERRYLPQLEGQSRKDYENYLLRASFYGITEKTISAMVGMATYKPPIVRVPDELLPYVQDTAGAQFNELVNITLRELLLMGRFALMVDAPVGGGEPFIVTYNVESVRNWALDNNGVLRMVVLGESEDVPNPNDPYEFKIEQRYRKLELTGEGCAVTVFNQAKEVISGPTLISGANGQPLGIIPLVIVTPTGVNTNIIKPPMEDIVNINMSHYRTSADLEWGRHMCALPTPVVSGATTDNILRIGGTAAWVLPDPQAKAYFLEFQGLGLKSLENALQEKQSQLASMSARMLDQATRGSEAADAVRLRYLSETASLAQVVRSTQRALISVLGFIQQMMGVSGSVEIDFPTDFVAARLSAADIKALFEVYLRGGMSKESFVYNLRRGDLLDPTRTDDEEMTKITEPTPGAVGPTSTITHQEQ